MYAPLFSFFTLFSPAFFEISPLWGVVEVYIIVIKYNQDRSISYQKTEKEKSHENNGKKDHRHMFHNMHDAWHSGRNADRT